MRSFDLSSLFRRTALIATALAASLGLLAPPASAGQIVRFLTTTAEGQSSLNTDPTAILSDAFDDTPFITATTLFDSVGAPIPGSQLLYKVGVDVDTQTGSILAVEAEVFGRFGAEELRTSFSVDRPTGVSDPAGLDLFNANNGFALIPDPGSQSKVFTLFVGYEGSLPTTGGRVDLLPFNTDNNNLLVDPVFNPLNSTFLDNPGTGALVNFFGTTNPSLLGSSLADVTFGGFSQADLDNQPDSGGIPLTEAFLFGTVIPEPASLALLAAGCLLLTTRRRASQPT